MIEEDCEVIDVSDEDITAVMFECFDSEWEILAPHKEYIIIPVWGEVIDGYSITWDRINRSGWPNPRGDMAP